MKRENTGGANAATVNATVIGDVQITEHGGSDFEGPYLSVEQGGEVVIDYFLRGRLEDYSEGDVRGELECIYG